MESTKSGVENAVTVLKADRVYALHHRDSTVLFTGRTGDQDYGVHKRMSASLPLVPQSRNAKPQKEKSISTPISARVRPVCGDLSHGRLFNRYGPWQEPISRVDRHKCIGCLKCVERCLNEARGVVGRQFTLKEIRVESLSDMPFYSRSGGELP